MKRSLNMLADASQQPVKFGWIVKGLVGSFGSPDAIASSLVHFGMPLIAQKAFVTEDVAVFDALQDDRRRRPLILVGRHQVIDNGHPLPRGEHDQLVAETIQLARGAVSI